MIKKLLSILCVLAISTSLLFGQANLFGRAAVTQITSATTAVTLDASSGVITTFALTNAANVATSFTVNCSAATASSAIQVSINGYSGTITTNGTPAAFVDTKAAGSFVIRVVNLHPANALNGTVKVAYTVIN